MVLTDIKKKIYLFLPLLPLAAIGIFCIRYGQNFFDYFLPNSQWNDEVIYYKVVEGISKYGMPLGYFGYNESHASIGTLAAWSPVVYIIDVIWGKLIGWNYWAPIAARIIFAIVGMSVFAYIYKPDVKKTIFISFFVISFSLYARYLASQMVDCYIVTLSILYLAFLKRKDILAERKISFDIYFIIILLTLMRPYFVVLWLPVWSKKKSNRKWMSVLEYIISIVSLVFYFALTHFMTAAYTTSLIRLDWLKLIFINPIAGIRNIISIVGNAIGVVNGNIVSAFEVGNDVGVQYFVFYVTTLVFFTFLFLEKDRKWLAWFAINVTIWFAIVLLYDVRVGSRHLMPFIIMEGMFLLGLDGKKHVKVFLTLIVLFLCLIKLKDPYLMTYPQYNDALSKQLTDIQEELDKKIDVDDTDKWDNTVIWVLADTDGGYPWQTLYSLPKGMGINLCTYDYMIENIDTLNSRYIACTLRGDVSRLCNERKYEQILIREGQNICIYKRF